LRQPKGSNKDRADINNRGKPLDAIENTGADTIAFGQLYL